MLSLVGQKLNENTQIPTRVWSKFSLKKLFRNRLAQRVFCLSPTSENSQTHEMGSEDHTHTNI